MFNTNALKDRFAQQPAPRRTVRSNDVNELVYRFLEASGVRVDRIMDRQAAGLRKYGTPLTTHNGRSQHRDAEDELTDAVGYLLAAITETMEDLEAYELGKEYAKALHLVEQAIKVLQRAESMAIAWQEKNNDAAKSS